MGLGLGVCRAQGLGHPRLAGGCLIAFDMGFVGLGTGHLTSSRLCQGQGAGFRYGMLFVFSKLQLAKRPSGF